MKDDTILKKERKPYIGYAKAHKYSQFLLRQLTLAHKKTRLLSQSGFAF